MLTISCHAVVDVSLVVVVTGCRGNVLLWMVTDCAAGYYGLGCQGRCLCANNASCDVVSGSCDCLPGWTGPACDQGNRHQLHLLMNPTCLYYT